VGDQRAQGVLTFALCSQYCVPIRCEKTQAARAIHCVMDQ
jgi:hypothetical protein